ncbi:transporter substrate-binding domain-containing protein, partial [Sutterella parvirubra]
MHATRRLILTAAAGLTLMMSGITAATAADEPAKGPNGLPILKVGTSGTFPPFEFHNSETGELVGFEIDLVRAIGQKMGRDVVISDFSFDAILPAITSGTIDMGAAGFAKTAERAKRIHFCDTFYYSGLTIIKRKGDTRINGIEDLEGKTISVQLGSISHERAKKIPGAKVVTFESGSEAMLNLITENC